VNITSLAADATSVLRDVATDRAGFWPRLVLSIAAALVLLSAMLMFLGVIELSQRVDDEHVAAALAVAGGLWCASLIRIWLRYRRFGRLIVGGLAVIGVWTIVIPLAVFIESTTYRADFMIAGVIVFGFAMTAMIILMTLYGLRRGKPVFAAATGAVDVICPQCAYDLTGLRECRCPECGLDFTIDELIRRQGYENASPAPKPPPAKRPAGSAAVPADTAAIPHAAS